MPASTWAQVVDPAAVSTAACNERAAFLIAARFLEANGRHWKREDVTIDASMVEDIAARR
jgi:hypothetical protein